MSDVLQGLCFVGRTCVWPVNSLTEDKVDQNTMLLIHIEYDKYLKPERTFNAQRDSGSISEIANVVARVIKNLQMKRKVFDY